MSDYSHGYCYKVALTLVVLLGILGNLLVILCISRRRQLLKNNFYCLVFHVTISDLCYLLFSVYEVYIALAYGAVASFENPSVCLAFCLARDIFLLLGAYFMLVISVCRYHAVLKPLKPAISSQRLKSILCFVYLSTLLVSGQKIYFCLVSSSEIPNTAIVLVQYAKTIIWYVIPVTTMTVIYWKICWELIRQNNVVKCSTLILTGNQMNERRFKRLAHHRNWRAFLVSFVTVVCFAVGGLPRHVGCLLWASDSDSRGFRLDLFLSIGWLIQATGTCAINPLIYGILDKKLLLFLKFNHRKQ